MIQVQINVPTLRSYADMRAENYPTGHVPVKEVLIRTAFKEREEEIKAGGEFEFSFPGYGVITFRGRKFTFVPTAEYARAKGYEAEIVGSWG